VAIGAAIGGLTFLQDGPTALSLRIFYWASVVGTTLVALAFLIGYLVARKQEVDSLRRILKSFDELLATYEFVGGGSRADASITP
jgi:hypothetical protein